MTPAEAAADILEMRKRYTLGGIKIKDLMRKDAAADGVPLTPQPLCRCFADESTHFGLMLLRRVMESEEVVAPAHSLIEVLSALIQGKRRGRIDDIGTEQFIGNLASFRISVEQSLTIAGLRDLKALSDKHNLTACAAAYLELAKRTGLPLATLDAPSAKACHAEYVAVLTVAS